MSTLVTLNEAAKITGKSVTWVRNQAKTLEKEGRASKKTGKWMIEREILLALNVRSKKIEKTPKVLTEN